MRMGLPILVHKDHRLLAGVLLFAAAAILYLTSNHFHIFRPRLLPLSRIDVAVPFVPQTVWLYVSEYLYAAVIYLQLPGHIESEQIHIRGVLSSGHLRSGLLALANNHFARFISFAG